MTGLTARHGPMSRSRIVLAEISVNTYGLHAALAKLGQSRVFCTNLGNLAQISSTAKPRGQSNQHFCPTRKKIDIRLGCVLSGVTTGKIPLSAIWTPGGSASECQLILTLANHQNAIRLRNRTDFWWLLCVLALLAGPAPSPGGDGATKSPPAQITHQYRQWIPKPAPSNLHAALPRWPC